MVNFADEKELQILKIEREGIKDVWTDKISARIFQLQQENSDEKYISYLVQKIKKYFKKDIIIKEEEFFEEVVARINSVIETIEATLDVFRRDGKLGKNRKRCTFKLKGLRNDP